ncbi:MAG TPA: hypothetical protein VGM06_08555 [Polyangiaceae bacterium]|jgi:hypothetical protein
MIPFERSARATAATTCLAIALAGIVAGAVRILPWLLDPAVPWRVAAPFARGLAALALESALVVGWPVGWTLACFRSVERGEARVLQTLGERPARTVARLAPQGTMFALLLVTISLVSGADATAPGRIATELLTAGRDSCASASAPSTFVVPFTGMTWLCTPGHEPRLAGAIPGAMSQDVVLTAKSARIAGDFRSAELEDARLLVAGPARTPFAVHVASLLIHGMSPWARASTLKPLLRALLLALAAWSTASVAAYGALRLAVRSRAGAILLGAAGSTAALGLMRAFERAELHPSMFMLIPVAACGSAAGAAFALSCVSRLRESSASGRISWKRLTRWLARRIQRC